MLLQTDDLREVETVAATMAFVEELQEFDVEGTAAEQEEHVDDWADGPVDFELAAEILVPSRLCPQ